MAAFRVQKTETAAQRAAQPGGSLGGYIPPDTLVGEILEEVGIPMERYRFADIEAVLGAVVNANTKAYKTDFDYDIKTFADAVSKKDGENNRFIWFSRRNGTECALERDTRIAETFAYYTFQFYTDRPEEIRAYAVEVTGLEAGRPVGHLYELDYLKEAEQYRREAQVPREVTFILDDSRTSSIGFLEYKKNSFQALKARHGNILRFRFLVPDEMTLQLSMNRAQSERNKAYLHPAPQVPATRQKYPKSTDAR